MILSKEKANMPPLEESFYQVQKQSPLVFYKEANLKNLAKFAENTCDGDLWFSLQSL